MIRFIKWGILTLAVGGLVMIMLSGGSGKSAYTPPAAVDDAPTTPVEPATPAIAPPTDPAAITDAATIDSRRLCATLGNAVRRDDPSEAQYQLALIARANSEANANIAPDGLTRISNGAIRLGDSPCAAIASMGAPTDINRTVGSFGEHLQYVYSSAYLYFENNELTAWQD